MLGRKEIEERLEYLVKYETEHNVKVGYTVWMETAQQLAEWLAAYHAAVPKKHRSDEVAAWLEGWQ